MESTQVSRPSVATSKRADHGLEYTPAPARMQYRNRPVSVAVDPVSLVISECIAITSAIQKHARSPHSSVSAILGGSPNLGNFGPASPASRGGLRTPTTAGDSSLDLTNRWGLRGKKGKSIQDNPLMAAFGRLKHELSSVKGVWDDQMDLYRLLC